MSTVNIIGHVNHDRVWSLAAPLASGARISYSDRTVRLGGGGFHTGAQLARLGHHVRLVSNLADDTFGRAALSTLQTIGFDTTDVTMHPGETLFAEILLEPNGERTILTTGRQLRPPFAAPGPISGDAAYLNAIVLDAGLVAALEAVPLVVSQFPLHEATPRPADIVIGSRADFPADDTHRLWDRAALIAGPRLKTLVLTDGPRPISLYDGSALRHVRPLKQVAVADTIGAGDCFTGSFLHGLMQGLDIAVSAGEASLRTADWLSERAQAG